LFIFIFLTCFSLGCTNDKKTNDHTKSGGVLYFGIETPFHGFDVLGTSGYINPTMAPLNNLLMEPLFRMNDKGDLLPVLGLSATPSHDSRIWEIKLRKGVFFHDGIPFNADAVVNHWQRILKPNNKYKGRTTFKPISSVVKIDDYTIHFNLDYAWPSFLEVISDELLLFNFIPSPEAVENGVHDRKPVGTGPFKYHSWNSGDHFIVVRNGQYWKEWTPLLNKIVFRSIPDHQTRYASLLSGEIDLITLDRGNLINKARKNKSLFTSKVGTNGAEIILLNTSNPPLNDVRVRRALAMANNQVMHTKIVYGNTIPFIRHPLGEDFNCKNDGYLEYNPKEAKELIKSYGKPVEIECIHSNTSRGRDIGAVLQQLLKEIDVKVSPLALSTGPHVMKVLQMDYQMATWRIPPSRDLGPQLYRSFHSDSPANFTGYSDLTLDIMLENQQIEADKNERKKLLCKIINKINNDAPFLYRGGRSFHIIARKKIKGMMSTPGYTIDLASTWLDEQVKFNTLAYNIEKNAAVELGLFVNKAAKTGTIIPETIKE